MNERIKMFVNELNAYIDTMYDKRKSGLDRLQAYWQAVAFVSNRYLDETIIEERQREETIKGLERRYKALKLDRVAYHLRMTLGDDEGYITKKKEHNVRFEISEILQNRVSFEVKNTTREKVEDTLYKMGKRLNMPDRASAERVYNELCEKFGEENVSIIEGKIDYHKDKKIVQSHVYRFCHYLP